ncbi:sensor histidine kinase [Pseudoduganella sp. GCM10020061]|uniref:sensor histidine kinase n=1 Tax=Pseudoduganella sp. GCM10020061 TaxID=3317345 RepID=UPI003632DF25
MEQGRTHLSTVGSILAWLHRAFDAVATWVTQLSWWKFLLFASLSLIAATILQDELFSGPVEEIVVHDERNGRGRPETQIMIDDRGIHFNPGKQRAPGAPAAEAPAAEAPPELPEVPVAPVAPRPGAAGDVHIPLPPQIGEELSIAIEQAVEDAAEQKVTRYHKQASTWFRSFVLLLLIALFATKALVGGKKRAELQSREATEAAERESMHRQLSEAKMQMMQAQVEPHFLFNTLASVEHLIETDPPRASAMQRSLIQYLRAVLPQMRDNNVVTNLGREADMVRAYLNLLKMRMEERLTVSMEVPEYLRSAAFPPMMLQSLVENAIKHGLECKPEGGTLRIFADVVGERLRVIVSDNGVGFGMVPSTGTGTGLTNIRERLKMLFGERATLRIGPNEPTGVVATIEVPYQPAK